MLHATLSPMAESVFSLLCIGSLLLAFAMLGSRWLTNYLFAFAVQSWLIAFLSAAMAWDGGYVELYFIAVLTALLRGLLLPYLLLRIVRQLDVERELHVIVQPSSSLVLGALLVLFAFTVAAHVGHALGLDGSVAVLALTVMLSMKLIGFLMLAVRREAMTQILGLLELENGIFLGSQILVPQMPMLIELVVLFDLLVVVASLGVLVRYLVVHVGSTSSHELKRLVG
jgi:hydrogenase-4 component E